MTDPLKLEVDGGVVERLASFGAGFDVHLYSNSTVPADVRHLHKFSGEAKARLVSALKSGHLWRVRVGSAPFGFGETFGEASYNAITAYERFLGKPDE